MIETFAALADRIRDKPASVTPRFVAIDGPSGAGKSTFALRLARSLGDPPLVEMDDFLFWDDLSGWWSRLEHEVLRPLMRNERATYQQRDWKHDLRGSLLGNWRTVAPARDLGRRHLFATTRSRPHDLCGLDRGPLRSTPGSGR